MRAVIWTSIHGEFATRDKCFRTPFAHFGFDFVPDSILIFHLHTLTITGVDRFSVELPVHPVCQDDK